MASVGTAELAWLEDGTILEGRYHRAANGCELTPLARNTWPAVPSGLSDQAKQ